MLKKKWFRIVLIVVLAAIVLAVAGFFVYRYIIIRIATTHTPDYTLVEWFELAPEGIVSANGSPVTSRMKIGDEDDKVIVVFYGGGISLNEYTASHPFTTTDFFNLYEEGFYAPDITGMIPDLCDIGLGSMQEDNPFRSWSVIIIPYTTADYHLGTADYVYTDTDGQEQVLHHHGYTNYRALMDEAIRYIKGPVSELLIAGVSAGGFGATILADEILTDYFPEAEHVTLCVDSACQYYDRWAEVAREVWGAPEQYVALMQTDNLLLDAMTQLYETYGDWITYLYIGSVWDGSLSKYQNYLDTGRLYTDNLEGQRFQKKLKDMVTQLKEAVPGIGIYLNTLPFSATPGELRLTQHTILLSDTVFWELDEDFSPADWLMLAVQGEVRDRGLTQLG